MTGGEAQPRRIAVTGAAGSLGTDILPGLLRLGYRVVGVDTRRPASDLPVDWVRCSVNDREALADALAGCDAVVHLAGIPLEADWEQLLHVNIDGTQAVLETARTQGVPRVVLASSIHAAGYVPVPPAGQTVPDDVPARPNTFYGVSKVALEALGSLYHDRHGMEVVCLRIASRYAQPLGERMLGTWLSPDDAVRLFDAALTVPSPGFRVVWGVSANSRCYLSDSGAKAIGYRPHDNAERFAEALFDAAANDPSISASEWDRRYIGGIFSSPEPPRFQPFAEEEYSCASEAERRPGPPARHDNQEVTK